MFFGHKNLASMAIALTIAGCASQPTPSSDTDGGQLGEIEQNLAILQAQADLDQARSLNAEWMVREETVHHNPVTLGEILTRAQQAHQDGDEAEAIRLARIVSRFARLGLEQTKAQSNASPYYPQ
ncbi:MAG: hypothetical protein WBM41_08060 [Arenicellales bacterium]